MADSCSIYCLPGPQVFFCRAAFQLVGPQPLLVRGVINPKVQDSVFPFSELVTPVATFFQTVKVLSNTILQCSYRIALHYIWTRLQGLIYPPHPSLTWSTKKIDPEDTLAFAKHAFETTLSFVCPSAFKLVLFCASLGKIQ